MIDEKKINDMVAAFRKKATEELANTQDTPRENIPLNDNLPRKPDFKGEGVAVWTKQDTKGRTYLTVKILDNIRVNCWQNTKE